MIKNSTKTFLVQIEARLQALIEGSAARLFPFNFAEQNLAVCLVEAMQIATRLGPDGIPAAPSLFILKVHPDQAQSFQENHALLEGLSQALREVGTESGVHFNTPPVIQIASDAEVKPGEVKVVAQNSLENLPQTSELSIENWQEATAIPAGAFIIVDGTQTIPLTRVVINIGRRNDNDIVIEDSRVSRLHAQIRVIKGRYVIFDLDSTGGTFVNGERVHHSPLYSGDVVSLSGVPLVFGQDATNLGETQEIKSSLT